MDAAPFTLKVRMLKAEVMETLLYGCICRNMGNSGKLCFHYLEHESRCGSSKPTPNTSERLGYEARKNAKKSN